MGGIYMEILKVEGVSKQIKNHRILDNISFSIFENEIVGLIGPNGAGKSTIMKCITGLYHMSEGKITICGYDLNIPWWRSHPIHENRATESICTEPCNPLLRATKSMKRATSTY